MPANDGGLGSALVGEKIVIGSKQVAVTKLLGEGGFSYVYLVKELTDTAQGGSMNSTEHKGKTSRSGSNGSDGKGKRSGSMGKDGNKAEMVLKVTSILSRQQRDIAEKEAKLLSRLSHPSIIKMFDTNYRTVQEKQKRDGKVKERPQHLILMEFCEGGHALDVCSQLAAKGEKFDLSSLIIAFGQICNAVSYLHAQRPPIVHRDLKPANFLIKNGAYKLCDFGSAVFGHVDLKTSEARSEAEEVIQKTTTQMFRAPEMVDLFVAKKLTQATDVWALGCCLYSLAFLQNCFEEGSNLAILSRNYKIPDDNPYGEGLVELLDRMLTLDSKARADMTEVILCLSAVYSGRPLPPRKEKSSGKKKDEKEADQEVGDSSEKKSSKSKKSKGERVGTFRTDGQGIYEDGLAIDPKEAKKAPQAKKLDPNSAAARRKKSAAAVGDDFASFDNKFDQSSALPEANADAAFSADAFSAFGDNKSDGARESATDIFASFSDGEADGDRGVKGAFEGDDAWGASGDIQFEAGFAAFGEAAAKAGDGENMQEEEGEKKNRRSSGNAAPRTRRLRKKSEEDLGLGDSMEELNLEDSQDGGEAMAPKDSDSARRSRTTRTRRRVSDGRASARRVNRSKSRDRKDSGVEANEEGVIEEGEEEM
mmetsp:Transcript_29423/g.68589  ORF Transcript_29423/g.68589 Transcript_29423/m.68589 type:complete len:648 (+) Transcript_29423:249-2192(+)